MEMSHIDLHHTLCVIPHSLICSLKNQQDGLPPYPCILLGPLSIHSSWGISLVVVVAVVIIHHCRHDLLLLLPPPPLPSTTIVPLVHCWLPSQGWLLSLPLLATPFLVAIIVVNIDIVGCWCHHKGPWVPLPPPKWEEANSRIKPWHPAFLVWKCPQLSDSLCPWGPRS